MEFILSVKHGEGEDILKKSLRHHGMKLPGVNPDNILRCKDLTKLMPGTNSRNKRLIDVLADVTILQKALEARFPELSEAIELRVNRKLNHMDNQLPYKKRRKGAHRLA